MGHVNSSNPFKELWDKLCLTQYQQTVALQSDCVTRFSSTVAMLSQAVQVKEVVELIYKWTHNEKEWEKHHVCSCLVTH